MSASDGSVTQWVEGLKRGEAIGAQLIWERYLGRLIRLANSKLSANARRVADGEDVVVKAFAAFLAGMERGKFSQLADRDELWSLLVKLTERKAIDQMRWIKAERRGGDKVVHGDSALAGGSSNGNPGIQNLPDDAQPTPDFVMQATEELGALLNELDSESLCDIAIQKMNGWTNQEIADGMNRSVRSVERKLQRIRDIWRDSAEERGLGRNGHEVDSLAKDPVDDDTEGRQDDESGRSQ